MLKLIKLERSAVGRSRWPVLSIMSIEIDFILELPFEDMISEFASVKSRSADF